MEVSLGAKWISGIGPNIPLKVSLSGNIDTELKSEFKEAGINQTLHRITLEISCKVSVLTPYETVTTPVLNEIVLAENIIVGDVPDTYGIFEGIRKNRRF